MRKPCDSIVAGVSSCIIASDRLAEILWIKQKGHQVFVVYACVKALIRNLQKTAEIFLQRTLLNFTHRTQKEPQMLFTPVQKQEHCSSSVLTDTELLCTRPTFEYKQS